MHVEILVDKPISFYATLHTRCSNTEITGSTLYYIIIVIIILISSKL
jgi:hypothetical protein